MKRSEVNLIIDDAKFFFEASKFMLPEWALWLPGEKMTRIKPYYDSYRKQI
jgi:D-lyxose ketol-isomerase